MNKILTLLAVAFASVATAQSHYCVTPVSSPEQFVKVESLSDEFSGSAVDKSKWSTLPPNMFAVWSFADKNVSIKDGILELKLEKEEHTRGQKQLYFKSGMVISHQKATYGYYEARIKGADVWPGSCSAFWLYTNNKVSEIVPQEENAISYNEIDIIEMQQIARDREMICCNLHVMALKPKSNGKGFQNKFLTAGMFPNMGRNEFKIPGWKGEEKFHIYACENRPDSIVFYIDNKRVAAKPNLYWHLSGEQGMRVTLSLGVRTPYEKYTKDRKRIAINPDSVAGYSNAGFPAIMQVDWIRCYTRKDGYDSFPSNRQAKFNVAHFK